MKDLIGIIIVGIASYLLGSVSFATFFSKQFAGIDPKEHGSKNPGATNVLRTAGILPAVLTFVFDILKGVVPVLLAVFLAKWTEMEHGFLLPQVAGICAILGHMFSIYYKFVGGKGIATGLGVIIVLNWHIALIIFIFALLIIFLSGYVSLGSILGVLLYFVLSMFLSGGSIVSGPTLSFVITALIISMLIFYKHRENIKRLRRGEENQFSYKKKTDKKTDEKIDEETAEIDNKTDKETDTETDTEVNNKMDKKIDKKKDEN